MPPCQSALIDVMCSAAARLLQPPGRHVLKWDTGPCRQGPVRGRKTRRPLWPMCWLVLSSSCPVILVDGGFSARRVWAKRHFPKVDKQVLLALSRTARCKSEVPCKGPCLARCFSAVVASVLFLSYDGTDVRDAPGALKRSPSQKGRGLVRSTCWYSRNTGAALCTTPCTVPLTQWQDLSVSG